MITGCGSSDDECIKTVSIPQVYFVNNQSYSYNITQEVPCDFPEPETSVQITPPKLDNFSYEILNFNFNPDTGNNTSRLQFEIKLQNNNGYVIKGIPILTLKIDGIEFTGSYSSNASFPCYQLEANSDCILTYDKQSSLDLEQINSIELIKVEYYLTN
ncbi:hypothetical protein [Gillisia sp. CAL575]|uniref:hypothetical protein n=1 Tax=Gillisia sp. CAL575 TaxID=985255 RepID=UPI0003A7639F|nr:hypothetical protein [Gillisia sp. CAL575]